MSGNDTTSDEIQNAAESIHDNLPSDVDATVDVIADHLNTYVDEYKVPLSQARPAVESKLVEDSEEASTTGNSGNGGDPSSSDELVDIGDLDRSHDEEWFNLEAEVLQLWDYDDHGSVYQKGLLGDNTGSCVFTIFESSRDDDHQYLHVEEGQSYRFEGVIGEMYDGELQVKLNRGTDAVEEIDESFEPPENDTEIAAPLANIQNGSGLIKRDVETGEPVRSGDDPDETEFDLRIKAVMDDGSDTHQVLFDAEHVEQLTGIDLEEAKEMAQDALDTEVVIEEIEPQVIGRYLHIEGRDAGEYVLVNELNTGTPTDNEARAGELLDEHAATTEVEA